MCRQCGCARWILKLLGFGCYVIWKSFAVGWQCLAFKRYCGENVIPDCVLCQWGHIQTTQALLYKGQFLLIWMTLVLCSEQRLCDFNLHLWCKIKRIVNRFHWCSFSFFPAASSLQFRLQYNGLNNPVWAQKKKKGSPTSQKMTLQ